MAKTKKVQVFTTFVENVKERRRALGWSQETLAEKASISENAVKLIETSKRNPRIDTIVALAKGFRCHPWELLSDGTAPTAIPADHKAIFSEAARILEAYGKAGSSLQASIRRQLGLEAERPAEIDAEVSQGAETQSKIQIKASEDD